MTVLDEILAHKRRELAESRRRIPPAAMRTLADRSGAAPRGFRAALASAPRPRIVAEIKRRSPSRGEIRTDVEPAECAKIYADAGAAALSVLTDERFFGGRGEFLEEVRRSVELPVLRKDFVVDSYQIDESAALGADAVLLIVAALRPDELRQLRGAARARGLDALVEVHDERELDTALEAGADLVGINNRNLHTFEVDLRVTERLAGRLPRDAVCVAESGIASRGDVDRLEAAGAQAFLVGESLMREPDIGSALRELRGRP